MDAKPCRKGPAMMNIIKNSEQGAALIMALLTVVVISIIGLVLLDVLKNALIQAATSEAKVQAEMIAQKGLDETISVIRARIDQANDSSEPYRARVNEMDDKLTDLLQGLANKSGEVPGLKGYYSITITQDNRSVPTGNPVTYPDYPYVKEITVTSVGTIPGKPGRSVTKQMELYVSTIHPVFRFPVSASDDLSLNGFPLIVGDVLVGGNLIHSNRALFVGAPESLYEKETVNPAIKGFLNVQDQYFERQAGTENSYKESSTNFSSAYFTDQAVPFLDENLYIRSDYAAVPIADYVQAHTGSIGSIVADSDYTTIPFPEDEFELVIGQGFGQDQLFGKKKVMDNWVSIYGKTTIGAEDGSESGLAVIDGALNVGLPSADQPLRIHNGNVHVRYVDDYVDAANLSGHIILDKGHFIAVEGHVTLNDQLYLQGNLYVNGDLRIIGSVRIDGTVYVNGNVELKEIHSINASDTDKPVIIMSTGSFNFDNNENYPGVKEMRAFFYSDQDLNLYGILSKLLITGGIRARNIGLNALGEKEGASKNDNLYGSIREVDDPEINEKFKFASQTDLLLEDSNLQIFYDDALYNNPPIGIPTTEKFHLFVKNTTYP